MPEEDLMTREKITIEIFRYDPQKDKAARYQSYKIPLEKNMSVLRCLEYIREEIDGGLAYRMQECKIGVCGLCLMRINGKIRLACKTLIKEERSLKIEPVDKQRVIRDLVITRY